MKNGAPPPSAHQEEVVLRCITAAAFALPILLTAAARAGTLGTGPTYVAPSNSINCELVNLGTKAAREVVAEIVRIDLAPNSPGSVVLATIPADVEPLGLHGASLLNEGAGAMFACRFSAKGSGSALRGTAFVTDGSLAVLDSQGAR